jgi:hypothetical protein
MLNSNIYYHEITRKLIVAFGSLFSDIKVQRKKDGVVEQTIAIPIAYAPKEKWIVRLEQDPGLDKHTYITLPRMSFEITGLTYDAARKTNRMNYITCGDLGNDTMSRVYAPVPWNIDISLYVLTKTQEDALQIIEQILPYFGPEYTLSIKAIPDSNIIMDVPIILDGVTVQDDYDGDFQTRRFVTYTLNFTLKANMYGPVSNGKVIANTLVDLNDATGFTLAGFSAEADLNTGEVLTESWTESN